MSKCPLFPGLSTALAIIERAIYCPSIVLTKPFLNHSKIESPGNPPGAGLKRQIVLDWRRRRRALQYLGHWQGYAALGGAVEFLGFGVTVRPVQPYEPAAPVSGVRRVGKHAGDLMAGVLDKPFAVRYRAGGLHLHAVAPQRGIGFVRPDLDAGQLDAGSRRHQLVDRHLDPTRQAYALAEQYRVNLGRFPHLGILEVVSWTYGDVA